MQTCSPKSARVARAISFQIAGTAAGRKGRMSGNQSLPVPSVFPAGLSGSKRVSRLASTGTSRL